MYDGPQGVSPQPETRSERLARTFKDFMEADFNLHAARESLIHLEGQANDARAQLRHAEEVWTKISTMFADALMVEAPAQLKIQMQQEQSMRSAQMDAPEKAPTPYGLGQSNQRRW